MGLRIADCGLRIYTTFNLDFASVVERSNKSAIRNPQSNSPSYCFSKTTVSSVRSPSFGDCVTILVIVLPSAERVILRLKNPPSEVHSITSASPSHLALVFAVLPMTSCSVSLPSVVYLACIVRSPCGVYMDQPSRRVGSLWYILLRRLPGPSSANLLFLRYIYHAPMKSG